MTVILASRPNAYTGSPLDRASALRDDSEWIAERLDDPASLFVPVWRSKTLVQGDDEPQAVFLTGAAASAVRMAGGPWAFLGLQGDQAAFAVDVSGVDDPLPLLPESMGRFEDLRALAGRLTGPDAAILAHARGLMHWRGRHPVCRGGGPAPRPPPARPAPGRPPPGPPPLPPPPPPAVLAVH